jgi:hypothetical protein
MWINYDMTVAKGGLVHINFCTLYPKRGDTVSIPDGFRGLETNYVGELPPGPVSRDLGHFACNQPCFLFFQRVLFLNGLPCKIR